jgi:hypothetical protein
MNEINKNNAVCDWRQSAEKPLEVRPNSLVVAFLFLLHFNRYFPSQTRFFLPAVPSPDRLDHVMHFGAVNLCVVPFLYVLLGLFGIDFFLGFGMPLRARAIHRL